MNDLENSLKAAVRFDIKSYHIKQDIESYVCRRAIQLGDKFELGHEKECSITAEVSNRSEGNHLLFGRYSTLTDIVLLVLLGMFLLARLIMDNFMAQDNIEELEEELGTEILPKGINEA